MAAMRFAIAALIAVAACGVPNRIVVEDVGEIPDSARAAVDGVEEWAGCELWSSFEVGGSRRDWRGMRPPVGTVTIEVDPGKTRGHEALARCGLMSRGRIYLSNSEEQITVVAHELIHKFGVGHSSGLMVRRFNADKTLQDLLDETPDSVRDDVRRWCLED